MRTMITYDNFYGVKPGTSTYDSIRQSKSTLARSNVIQIRMAERELELEKVPVSFFC